ncbi:tetratricopeptide repeat-containing hybrid sensor histidine kinase/response regulator [Neptunitalea lumnitzerae]|uniref:histidine kinase n=1 Tax=Neptunitalea lumnitzerae TaxID=2965509 RepID=A0ABQ5MNE1_9FLAO|nr:response regulator [Neptunitalea sp. Y10]GLB50868.1 histidine kinase [Neptunitalea sp. Y10]
MKFSFLKYFFFLISLTFSFESYATQSQNDSIPLLISDIFIYKNQGNYELALEKANILLEISETEENIEYSGIAHLVLAETNENLKRYDKALKFIDVAHSEFTQSNNDYLIAMSNIIKAQILINQNIENKDAIEKLLKKSASILSKNNLKEFKSNIVFTQGLLLHLSGEYHSAIPLFEKSLPVKNKYEQDYLTNLGYLFLGQAYLATNQLQKAELNADKAREYGEIFNFKKILTKTYKLYSDIYKSKGDFEQALLYANKYEQELNKEFDNSVLDNQDVYADQSEIEFQNKLIESINQQNIENNEKLSKSNYTSIFSSALLIIISLLTVSLYRNNKIKLKTNELLVKKNNELLRAKENAEKAMKAKTQFLSTVSHELRTPLYAVTGLTHLLLQENPTENQKEHLKSLKFSGEYLLTFINDILQINKIEAKKLTIQNVPFNLEEIMSDVINSLQQTSKESNNVMQLKVDNGIPPQLIGDPLKLSQIFINLVGNAIKFTENGEVNLVARILHETETHINIHFEINDNGIGISDEVQKNIFESFSQGSIQINRKYGGTGLGLNIVKSLLELLNSQISLQSKIGEGSSFYFDINFEKAKDLEIVPEEIVDELNTDDIIKDLHLLLVEDNKINQVITRKMLTQKNITCDIADDGYIAIEKAKENTYDAILMDIHMPGISGLKATQEIRKFDTKIPIIALTAISLDENTEDFYEVGCNDIVTKPFKPDEFYKKIAKNILENIRFNQES